jgi:hypothetical protein
LTVVDSDGVLGVALTPDSVAAPATPPFALGAGLVVAAAPPKLGS